MLEIKVYDITGAVVSTLELNERVFDAPENQSLVHQAVVTYQANQRQGTVHTLSRGEVSGGGRKPYRQKGTGRARQGSTRAPHWVGGGVVFGPKQREWRMRMPQKMRQGALRCVLSDKVRRERIRVLDSLTMETPRTRVMAELLATLDLRRKVLVVLDERNEALVQSLRNLPNVQMRPAAILNTYDVISADWLLTTASTMRMIGEKLA